MILQTMEKKMKYIVFVFVLLGLCSCNSAFLDETDPDAFDVSKFYKTEEDMEAALNAAYQSTRRFYNQMYFATEMKSDNTSTTNIGDSGGIYATFVTHMVTSNNSIVNNLWVWLYNCIYRSNLVLENIDNVKMSQESHNRIVAEAKFLRALSHFYLVRLFGPVPVVDHVIQTSSEAHSVLRDPVEDAYTLIISDLKEVANCKDLAVFETGDRLGHVTRTAGAALLGKVYVTMAATLNNKDYYKEAITYLDMACTLNNMQDLPTSYASVFGVDNEENKELIFQCMYLSNTTEYSTFAYDFAPYGESKVTSLQKGRGFNLGEQNLFDEFEANDVRLDVSIGSNGTDYYTRKYVDMSNASGRGGNNWIELRFADVFLLLAESYEQLGDNTNAIKWLDKVRVKHGELDGYEDSRLNDPQYAAHYPTLRDAIFHERRMELCFENHRWFDLQRLYPNPADLVTFMRAVDSGSTKYTEFAKGESLLPIPYDDTFLNPNLYQNDGY